MFAFQSILDSRVITIEFATDCLELDLDVY